MGLFWGFRWDNENNMLRMGLGQSGHSTDFSCCRGYEHRSGFTYSLAVQCFTLLDILLHSTGICRARCLLVFPECDWERLSGVLTFMIFCKYNEKNHWLFFGTHTHTVDYNSAIKKEWIMPFAATWIDLEIIILSKVREGQISYTIIKWKLIKMTQKNLFIKQINSQISKTIIWLS